MNLFKSLNFMTKQTDHNKIALEKRKLLYTNANGNIYEGDTVECFDVVACHITCFTGKELFTEKMRKNARVLKIQKVDAKSLT